MFRSIRSILRNIEMYLSGVLVLTIGLSVFIGLLSTAILFNETIDRYQSQTNFADVFATVVAMPQARVADLTRIPGVSQAQGTLEYTVNARMQEIDDWVNIRLVGVSSSHGRDINIYNFYGEPLEADNHIWLGKAFYELHNLSIGDSIRLLIDMQYQTFYVRGYVTSPEFIIVLPEGGALTDDVTNTIGFVNVSVVENASGLPGMVTEISMILEEGYAFYCVRPLLDERIRLYGLISLFDRSNHNVQLILDSNSDTTAMMATIIPILFISIAVSILYVTLKRLVEMERTEIGTLKAIGFSNGLVLSGYILQGAVVAIIGTAAAMPIGWIIGSIYYNMLIGFLTMDSLPFSIDIYVCLYAFLIAMGTCIFSAVMGARKDIALRPVEAMRSSLQIPKKQINFSFNGFFSRIFLDTGGRLGIRSMIRSPKRTATTILSIAFAFAFISLLISLSGYFSELTYRRFTIIETGDASVSLNDFVPRNIATNEINSINGVLNADAILAIPATLRHMGAEKALTIYGLDEDVYLFNIIDIDGYHHQVPSDGLMLARFFADTLGVSVGEQVTMQSLFLREDVLLEVSSIIDESMGIGAYMEISTLSSLFGSEIVSNLLLVNVETDMLYQVRDELIMAGNVSSFNLNAHALEMEMENAQATLDILNILAIVSVIICFAIIYNTANVALGEKKREYATLRILGLNINDVSEINSFEYIVMLIVGSVIGTVISYFSAPVFASLFNQELMIFNLSITIQSIVLSFIFCALAVFTSCIMIKRKIKYFELIDVLKETN